MSRRKNKPIFLIDTSTDVEKLTNCNNSESDANMSESDTNMSENDTSSDTNISESDSGIANRTSTGNIKFRSTIGKKKFIQISQNDPVKIAKKKENPTASKTKKEKLTVALMSKKKEKLTNAAVSTNQNNEVSSKPQNKNEFAAFMNLIGNQPELISTQKEIFEEYKSYLSGLDWSSGLKKCEVRKYKKLWSDICDDMIKVPLVSDILKLNINIQEKTEFIHKLIILNGMSFDSFEFIQIRKLLVSQYKQYLSMQFSQKQLDEYAEMENEMAKCHTNMDSQTAIKYSILGSNMSKKNKAFIYMRHQQISCGEDNGKIKSWIQTALAIPNNIHKGTIFNSKKPTAQSIDKYLYGIKNTLDKELYGMNTVKEKLLFFINNKIIKNDTSGGALALEGLPGIGKTCIVQALSKALDLPMVCIPIGGAKDASFLNGHGYTYEGSAPGAIVQALQELKCKNGIIFIDEIDKISQTEKGSEISKALLHIIDPSQNFAYHDKYLTNQFDIDLSKIWFIYTLNNRNGIDATLRDRIPIINMPGYTFKEKCEIAYNYIIPSALKNLGIDVKSVRFTDDAIKYLIQSVIENKMEICDSNGRSGVRQLKYLIEHLVMKINLLRGLWNPKYTPKLKLSFAISGFKLPLIVTPETINQLGITDFQQQESTAHMTMYM